MAHGNYYYNNYAGAKLDFACRSGLVQDSRQFTDEQLTELFCCIHETLDSEYPLTEERRKTLTAAADQIERSVDDLEERVEQSNQQELEEAIKQRYWLEEDAPETGKDRPPQRGRSGQRSNGHVQQEGQTGQPLEG